jgi:preprotein translocase subunit SecD
MNRTPSWKLGLLVIVLLAGLIYSLPNLFGEDPALQLSTHAANWQSSINQELTDVLAQANIQPKAIEQESPQNLLIRFKQPEDQIKAQDILKHHFGDTVTAALNLAPMTPKWLTWLGAHPMKLGLDLRGGVHFLMEVDVDSAIKRRMEGYLTEFRTELKNQKLRYTSISSAQDGTMLTVSFPDEATRDAAEEGLKKLFTHDLEIQSTKQEQKTQLSAQLAPRLVQEIRNNTVEQTIITLRNRVNELGVAEAVVQRQGLNHVVVELPGIQDTARAQDILGKTATLEFLLKDEDNEVGGALQGKIPPGSKLYYYKDQRPVLMKKRVILTGESITGAVAGADSQEGRPSVSVHVSGAGLGNWKKSTKENRGKAMGVVYIETKTVHETIDGQAVRRQKLEETLISVATINEPLGSRFQITGLSAQEAQNLALLLRAGALPTAISIVEERTVGPSLGQENIRLGILSIEVGMGLVILAMLLYYSVFGIVANLALLINLILLVAVCSLIGVTLTLPGIAGMILTVGMAVDANVLIFERIREELRHGLSVQASIHSGFERALATIIDSNLTTLIVGIILFSVGSGPIKGFAIVLCIGILTSMLTSVTYTRAIVNLLYGSRHVEKLPIGI